MKFFEFQIPSIQHLTPTEREEIVKQCIESDEMLRFKKVANQVSCVILWLCSVGVILSVIFKSCWSIIPDPQTLFILMCIFWMATVPLKLAVEIWIIKTLVKKKISP